ncbi:MAG: hypothetical protein M3619_07425 [Myxococcota bacterium]|nr:hypothetical protein [Myxococcota bacterium]
MGPGWLPTRPRTVGARRRTLPYTARRPRRISKMRAKVAASGSAVNHEDMIFDQPPAELPVATLVPREPSVRLAVDLRAWLVARWRWFRPRTVPMIVAFAGMLAVMGAANYLRNFARQAPERLAVPSTELAPLEVTVTVPAPAPSAVEPLRPYASQAGGAHGFARHATR